MDSESVTLATAVQQLLPSFNYYKRSTSSEPKSSSITKVDAPIVSGGTPMKDVGGKIIITTAQNNGATLRD